MKESGDLKSNEADAQTEKFSANRPLNMLNRQERMPILVGVMTQVDLPWQSSIVYSRAW